MGASRAFLVWTIFSRNRGYLAAQFYGRVLASVYLDETRREFETLIPHIPRIGGKRSRYSRDAIGMSYGLALYKFLRAHGRSMEEMARVVHVLAREKLASLPRAVKVGSCLFKALLGKYLFKVRSKRQTTRSQQRTDAGGIVAIYVKGDGREFDCGIDITHCPMWDFYRAQGAGEFLRFVCLYDFPAHSVAPVWSVQ